MGRPDEPDPSGPGRDGALQLETRRQVFLAVHRYPGLELSRIARLAGVDEDVVRYHVRVLEEAGLVRAEEEGARRRVYPLERTSAGAVSPLTRDERRIVGMLRRPATLRAVVALLEHGELSAGGLARACSISPSTASHHIKALEEAALITVRREGRERLIALADRALVLRLLTDYPPPRDLVQGFLEAWDELGI